MRNKEKKKKEEEKERKKKIFHNFNTYSVMKDGKAQCHGELDLEMPGNTTFLEKNLKSSVLGLSMVALFESWTLLLCDKLALASPCGTNTIFSSPSLPFLSLFSKVLCL
jgi:hypothetical protein